MLWGEGEKGEDQMSSLKRICSAYLFEKKKCVWCLFSMAILIFAFGVFLADGYAARMGYETGDYCSVADCGWDPDCVVGEGRIRCDEQWNPLGGCCCLVEAGEDYGCAAMDLVSTQGTQGTGASPKTLSPSGSGVVPGGSLRGLNPSAGGAAGNRCSDGITICGGGSKCACTGFGSDADPWKCNCVVIPKSKRLVH